MVFPLPLEDEPVLDVRYRCGAHRDDGQRFIVHADEKLTAFIELESAIPRALRALPRRRGRSVGNRINVQASPSPGPCATPL
jgi:hypothetical protein